MLKDNVCCVPRKPSVGNVRLKPIKPDQINYMDMSNKGFVPSVNPHQKNIQFWDSLFNKYD